MKKKKQLYELLEKYTPFDEEEAENIKTFLQFMDGFGDNILTRDNGVGHISSSALGGHADGDKDLLGVTIRKAN